MQLVIRGKPITASISEILTELKKECNGRYLTDIKEKGDNIVVTCPNHKDGRESNPSCSIYCGSSSQVEYGLIHCFTCGFKGRLTVLVEKCLAMSEAEAEMWLVRKFGGVFNSFISIDSPITFDNKKSQKLVDKSILEEYNYYHPYMEKRKITKEVARRFHVGYDSKSESITFPVWDEHNNLVMITRRNINNKNFFIPPCAAKPVYLLNECMKYKFAIITESQINCLTLWGYDIPACALLGTGSKEQYSILNKSGISHFYLALDGDSAGKNGTYKLLTHLREDIIVDIIKIPNFKDVNDLSFEEFRNLPIIGKEEWLKEYCQK